VVKAEPGLAVIIQFVPVATRGIQQVVDPDDVGLDKG